jgi:ABC-type multidrug transport system ATPase subunit
MQIQLQQVTKRFNQEVIFNNISLEINQPESVALLGINGSGKSTLLQILAGYSTPNEGKLVISKKGKEIDLQNYYKDVSYVAPYVSVIEEMTLIEFLEFHFSFKKNIISFDEIIDIIGLQKSKNKLIENFSSGMKQRVKIAQAVFADTSVLLLDEPCSNLDEDGINLYKNLIATYCNKKITVVASNDMNEYAFCERKIMLQDFK